MNFRNVRLSYRLMSQVQKDVGLNWITSKCSVILKLFSTVSEQKELCSFFNRSNQSRTESLSLGECNGYFQHTKISYKSLSQTIPGLLVQLPYWHCNCWYNCPTGIAIIGTTALLALQLLVQLPYWHCNYDKPLKIKITSLQQKSLLLYHHFKLSDSVPSKTEVAVHWSLVYTRNLYVILASQVQYQRLSRV
jgi:hypothetical protein